MRLFKPSTFVGFGCLFANPAAFAEVNSAVVVSTGVILGNASGYQPASEMFVKNFDFKWVSFQSRVLAAVGEFQVALSNKFQVTQIMETRAGVQYYPFAYGVDFNDLHPTSQIKYTANLKPYIHGKVGYGRYFITTSDLTALSEIASNYISVGGGAGTQYQFTRSVALDANIDGSYALGTSPAPFSGLLIRARFGLFLLL
ncbi:MAG: hypothetical protein FJY29_13410 [Betaproteobacteria bacterium]|nr:hypothetical protein [Betaproteobacteria bacterium]